MEVLELARPIKGSSWPSLILEVELCEPGWEEDKSKDKGRPFPLDKESSIRPAISGRVKLLHPERIYKANKEWFKGELVIMVRRIE